MAGIDKGIETTDVSVTIPAHMKSDARRRDPFCKPLHAVGALVEELVQPEPAHWRAVLPWWYKLSSIIYTLLGAVILIMLPTLAQFGAWFPWWFMGGQLLLQGVLSYMADTYTFGRRSRWKVADAGGALFVFFTCICVVIFTFAGLLTYPTVPLLTFIFSLLAGAYSKYRSSGALRNGRTDPRLAPDEFVIWHVMWHITIPGGSIVAMLLLLLYIEE